uniref:Uncharacterized protein n=1 Tax=Globisporangium ultimum (strain ATCC 200006 / CBS 805.95 / DAOM BR144) TaxID=431595 RepID=K3WD27_GLOUD
MKQNLSAITLKTKIKASATKQPKDSDIRTADPSSDYYDQLFLAELAKHDGEPGSEVHDDDSQNQNRLIADTSSQYRPEFDDVSARPQSGNSSKSERGCLPSLNTASVPVVKSKKKTSSTPSVSGNAHIRGNNNNQGAGPFPDDDEIRNSSTKVRIAKLEDELAQVRTKLAMSESQKHQLEQKCLQTQSQCTAMLQEKDDQVRKQLLEMEVVYHTKQSNQKPQSNGSEPKSSSADEITKLIETIDSLSFQIDQINVEKDHEKKQLSQSHQLDIKRLHEKYQLDMEALRLSEHSAKEQVETIQLQMFNLQNQAQIATTQAKNAKAALEDLTKNKLASLEEKNHRLERQLADARSNLQLKGGAAASSTLAQSSTFTSAQELEALEKHMSNKIDYLKAQLASEMKCKEELGSHLAQITNTMEQMKKERKQALAEQEETFKRQIQRMESTFAQEKDVMASQQAALQGKLVTLQANVTDLVQELTLWKSKEANAKLSMEKMVEENVRLTRQIVDLENQVEALMEERKHDNGNTSMSVKSANDETQRMQMEALLRRLDNERQYLKNQLENEQEMKEKSQKQVSNLQNEVDELKQMLEQVAKESEMKLSALAAEKLSADQQFQESIECLEESKLLLSRQFKEVQVKFSQAREQSLFDRDELEKMRIETNEMRSQLLASKENIAKEKEYGRNTSERSSKALMLVKNSLKAVEEEKNIRIQRLEDENGIYMKKLANTQAEMLVLEEKWIADKARVKKQHALTQLALIWKAKLSAWCMKQQFRSFHRLELSNRVYQRERTMPRLKI